MVARSCFTSLVTLVLTLSATSSTATVPVSAAAAPASPPPAIPIGSANTATADPPVARPATAPCVVNLFTGFTFADYSAKPFAYAPSAECRGPWAKVVFEGDFAVTAGRQFDRTANVWIGGANVYFGTTSEPSRTVARSWHVERDLTDYAPLFTAAQAGEVDLGNTVDSTYTGVLSGGARLVFYPVPRHHEAPRTADVVLPLSAGPTGGTATLGTPADTLSRSFTLPTNVERAYLDVISQSQSGDEFWYTCVPGDVAGQLQSCGGGSFRETLVTIDGAPAGVAPVYPWIYTGGIDPYLWQPIPGVQTLSFAPYRVDLTPFAGVLSDGKAHQVAIGVLGANGYFSATATLLLYLDSNARHVTGKVITNTLVADPAPATTENLTTAADGTVTGTVGITASRRFTIRGTAHTSHGEVTTTVTQSLDFSNKQTFDVSPTTYIQDIAQSTRIVSLTSTDGHGVHREALAGSEWPLAMKISYTTNADGSSQQTTTVRQEYGTGELVTEGGFPVAYRVVSNVVSPADTLGFDASGAFTGPRAQASSQRYFQRDESGCYSRAITAGAGLVTEVTDGKECGH